MEEPTRVEYVDESASANERDSQRHITQTLNELLNGAGNNHHIVTLIPNVTETVIQSPTCRPGSVAIPTPRTASSLVAMLTTWAETKSGEIVLHHTSDPATDREFGVVLFG